MHKYIIMGPQGCGKGTQARILADDFDLTHLAVGDIFEINSSAPNTLLRRNTKFSVWGPGGDQRIKIHTSCSEAILSALNPEKGHDPHRRPDDPRGGDR